MYDHIGIKVRNLDLSARFYAAVLEPLGHVPGYRDATTAGFGPPDAAALWLYAGDTSNNPGTHVAFRAPDQAAVHRFHAAALALGGRDNGGPGPRPDYSPTYYAAFVFDPDGNNIEAVVA